MKRNALAVAAAAMFILAGCSSDSTGPTGPQTAQVGGLWTYNPSNLSGTLPGGSGVTYFITDVALSLNQTGTTFTGNANGGNIRAFVDGVVVKDGPRGNQVVVNGTVNGNNVSFDIETQAWHHDGSVSGNSMSGTATVTADLGGTLGTVVLTGTWSAVR